MTKDAPPCCPKCGGVLAPITTSRDGSVVVTAVNRPTTYTCNRCNVRTSGVKTSRS